MGLLQNRGKTTATLITLRASSYSPLYDIKNQDDLFGQSKQWRRERERPQHFCCHNKSSQSIFFGHAFKLCQRRLILPPFPLKTRRPPPPTRKTRSPSHPSFQVKNGDLFLTSAQRFSENVKFMISCLPYNFSIFLIWDWRMLWILQIFPKSKAI